jgi:ATP-dependent protease ClpP protease subunit
MPSELVSNFLVASAQAQAINGQPIERGAGHVRSVSLQSSSGSAAEVVYWIDGAYIPEVLDVLTFFFSEVAETEVRINTYLLDHLAALQRVLGVESLIIEDVAVPDVPGRPVSVALSSPGHDPGQFCNAFAVIMLADPAHFCTSETGSAANPIVVGDYPHFYALSWQDGPYLPSADLLAVLEQPLQSSNGGMSLEFLRHNLSNQEPVSLRNGSQTLGCTHRLYGPIQSGDGPRLASALEEMAARLARERDRGVQLGGMVLCLQSPGGALQDGLQIAAAILQAGLPTRIEADAHCESTCFWMFMAGNFRTPEGLRQPDRLLSPHGRLGFHAPALYVNVPDPTIEEISTAMQVGMQAVAQINSTFAEQGSFGNGRPIVRPSLLNEMLNTPPEAMRWIETVQDAGRWDIQVGLPRPGPLPTRAFLQACANQLAWTREDQPQTGRSLRHLSAAAYQDRIDITQVGDDAVLCSFRAIDVVIQTGRLQQAVPVNHNPIMFELPQTRIRDLESF